MSAGAKAVALAPVTTTPRLGFLGVGWIGKHRMEAIAKSGFAQVAAISDPSETAAMAAASALGDRACATCDSLDSLLQTGVDGVVIATPSAQHAEQSIRAFEHGAAVFCQKPLGRTAEETARVVAAAKKANRLLGVDLSYRHLRGIPEVRSLLRSGELGEIYGVDLVFHNAYGPDKAWFYDPRLSGGGCVMDLGIHLVDLAMWMLPDARVRGVQSRLFSQGKRLENRETQVEDYAEAQLDLDSAAGAPVVRLSCSWKVHAGRDAVIEASFYGSKGGASLRNVNGSFYDFTVERFRGTAREPLAAPPDEWGGRAAVAWAERLAQNPSFDPEAEELVHVADALDRIYGR